jgi:hypothetical protein
MAIHAADVSSGSVLVGLKTEDGLDLEVTVVRSISSAEADSGGLFSVPLDRITTTATEVPIGQQTSLPVSPYWFGETLGNHSAFTAVEHETRLTDELRAVGWPERDATEAT